MSEKKQMKVSEKEEYVQSEETDMISKERQEELISKLKESIGEEKTIADHKLNEIIGVVSEEDYDREYQFLLDYLNEHGIVLRGISLEMDSINDLNFNVTERTGGPGTLNYRTRKQDKLIEKKRAERDNKKSELRKKEDSLKKLNTKLNELVEGSAEYKSVYDEINKTENEIIALRDELETCRNELLELSNLPMYDEKKNVKLFDEYNKIKLEIEQRLDNIQHEDIEKAREEMNKVFELERRLIAVREELVRNNIRLVYFAVYGKSDNPDKAEQAIMYMPESYEDEERIQEASIELLDAIDRYNPKRGAFSTYAVSKMRLGLSRYAVVSEKESEFTRGAIDLPRGTYALIRKIRSTKAILENDLKREPTYKEIGDQLLLPEEKIKELSELSDRIENIEDLYEADTNKPTSEVEIQMLKDAGQLRFDTSVPEETTRYMLLQDKIEQILDKLSDKERMVLRYRFGLEDGEIKTLEEVGREFGLTCARIRQIESKALVKFMYSSTSSELKDNRTEDDGEMIDMEFVMRKREEKSTEEESSSNTEIDPQITPAQAEKVSDKIEEFQEGIDEALKKVDDVIDTIESGNNGDGDGR